MINRKTKSKSHCGIKLKKKYIFLTYIAIFFFSLLFGKIPNKEQESILKKQPLMILIFCANNEKI
jgi:hypothetical protein